jgi:hypothetical protein
MEDFYKNSETRLVEQQKRIAELEQLLECYRRYDAMSKDILAELKVLYPTVTRLSISHAISLTTEAMQSDTVTLAVIDFNPLPDAEMQEQVQKWLKARTKAGVLKLILE